MNGGYTPAGGDDTTNLKKSVAIGGVWTIDKSGGSPSSGVMKWVGTEAKLSGTDKNGRALGNLFIAIAAATNDFVAFTGLSSGATKIDTIGNSTFDGDLTISLAGIDSFTDGEEIAVVFGRFQPPVGQLASDALVAWKGGGGTVDTSLARDAESVVAARNGNNTAFGTFHGAGLQSEVYASLSGLPTWVLTIGTRIYYTGGISGSIPIWYNGTDWTDALGNVVT